MSVTNQIASQALRGQNVKITLDSTDAASFLPTLEVGTEVQEDSFGTTGIVYSVDKYGNSFEVSPIQPDKVFGGEGYLLSSTNIDVVIS